MARLSGFTDEQSRALLAELARLKTELQRPDDPVVDRRERSTVRPQPGEVVRVQGGQTVVLPHARAARGRSVTLLVEDATPAVVVTADSGRVNTATAETLTTTGRYVYTASGRDWWGAPPVGGVAPDDAEYVLGAADPDLPNGRVATDSAEVDAVLTTPGVISWVLNAASVAFSKLADLTGLSVLGRAANSTGVMAAITSTAGRQVLRNNDGGTALAWGFPVEAQSEGVDLGDVHTVNVQGLRTSVASNVLTVNARPDIVTSATTSGTVNALVLPATMRQGDGYFFPATGAITLNGIDLQDSNGNDWPEGFEFVIGNASNTNLLTINDESGSAIALDRISTPRDTAIVVGNGFLVVRRFITRWGIIDRGWQDASTSIVYGGTGNLQLQRAALTGAITAPQNSNATTLANAIVAPVNLAAVASNIGALFAVRVAYVAAAAGTADDVTVYNANSPFAFRILKAFFVTSTAIGGSTVQVRSASGGGGSALSDVFSSATTGENTSTAGTITATATVAANGSVFVRRSDRGVAGEVILLCVRT